MPPSNPSPTETGRPAARHTIDLTGLALTDEQKLCLIETAEAAGCTPATLMARFVDEISRNILEKAGPG